jgi:hypothetical protein
MVSHVRSVLRPSAAHKITSRAAMPNAIAAPTMPTAIILSRWRHIPIQPRPILIRLQIISALICRTVSSASVASHAVLRCLWKPRRGCLAVTRPGGGRTTRHWEARRGAGGDKADHRAATEWCNKAGRGRGRNDAERDHPSRRDDKATYSHRWAVTPVSACQPRKRAGTPIAFADARKGIL